MQRFLSLLVVLMVLLMTGIPALAQDNQRQELGLRDVLVDGRAFEEQMKAPDTMHLYAFEAEAGSSITVNMTRTEGNLDPLLILLASDGALIAWDDDSGNDLNAQVSKAVEQTDLYFVLASSLKTLYQTGERDSIEGAYRIEVSGASNDSPEIERDPTRLALPRIQLDSAIPAGIDEQHPVFLAWLTVQDSITVDLSAPSVEIDTLMYVFDTEGRRMAMDDDGGEDGSSASVRALPLTEPGQYLVMVTSFDYHQALQRGIRAGNFQLVVNRSS